MFFLDTDIASLLMQENPRVTARLAATEDEEIALTLVTKLEMLRGRIEAILKAASATELLRAGRGLLATEEFVASYRVVPMSEEVAERFEQLRANKKLNKMDSGDRLQAALALAHSATLVTRNLKDYAHVPSLRLDNWAA